MESIFSQPFIHFRENEMPVQSIENRYRYKEMWVQPFKGPFHWRLAPVEGGGLWDHSSGA
jgi:hypothetical protein